MERLIHSRLCRVFSVILVSTAALYAQMSFAQDPGIQDICMEDRAVQEGQVNHLNCTANDINIASASNIVITHIDGNPVAPGTDTCVSGKDVTFEADFDVVSTASARYDIGLYFNREGGEDARSGSCNIYTLNDTYSTNASELDGDSCWDAEQGAQIVHSSTITTTCIDSDGDGQLNLPNCVSWRQPGANELCEDATGAFPGAPSKCNCNDEFNVPIFIQPDPPIVTKSITQGTTDTGTEPGQTFSYTVEIKPDPSTGNSVFVTKLEDVLSSSTDPSAGAIQTFLLNDGTSNDVGVTKGYYTLMSSGLASACENLSLPYEIPPESIGLKCTFKVHISDSDLPNIPDPEKFENFIRATILDENDDPVGDNFCFSPSTAGTPNPNCSNEIVVSLTNQPPAVTVEKTADKSEVLEPGETVVFTFDITNDSGAHDSPIALESLIDTIYGDLSLIGADSDCLDDPVTIAKDATYTCTLTAWVSGDAGDSFTNVVTAMVRDDENDTATDTDDHTVAVLDVPSAITLVKTANPTSVNETGDNPDLYRDVDYTFLFTVKSQIEIEPGVFVAASDTVTFSSLIDDPFGDLTGDCMVTSKNGNPIAPVALNGFELDPGEFASCTMTLQVQGNAGDNHLNVATISGTDEDEQPVSAMDSETVTFDPLAPDTDMAFATSLLVVIELTNASEVDDVTLTALTVKGENVFAFDGMNDEFNLLNTGGTYNGVTYSACNYGAEMQYSGSGLGLNVYSCAFTLELKPGLENTDDIEFLSQGALNGVVATVTDDEGDTLTNFVSVEVNTLE